MTLLSNALAPPAAEAQPPRVTDWDAEGYEYDVETGEVVGHRDAHELFRVATREDAEWVLALRAAVEAEILAVDARLAALRRNLEAQRRDLVRRLSWWDYRFGAELAGWARRQLEGRRSRTLKLDGGVVRFRKTPAGHRVIDDQAALAFVRAWRPDLIRVVERVTVKAVLRAKEAAERACGEEEEAVLPFLIAAPPGESCAIETGVAAAPARERGREPVTKGVVDGDDVGGGGGDGEGD